MTPASRTATRAIAAVLFGAFGLPVPRSLPLPAPAHRFTAIVQRAATPPLDPARLALGGTITTTKRIRR
jgi:hypothetical protein